MDPRICRHCLRPTAVHYWSPGSKPNTEFHDFACEPCREKVRRVVEPMIAVRRAAR